MYQVVIDTNVLVAALLSNRGASHRLLRLVGDPRWRINLSVALVFEYEQTLKRICTGGGMTGSDVDNVIYFSLRQRESAPHILSLAALPPRPKG
jgi:predicted nucleic acid-binding protein